MIEPTMENVEGGGAEEKGGKKQGGEEGGEWSACGCEKKTRVGEIGSSRVVFEAKWREECSFLFRKICSLTSSWGRRVRASWG